MCGINGVFGQLGDVAIDDVIGSMNRTIKHRGPDGEGIFSENHIGLGHVRLSIIEVTELGHQPMFSNNKEVVVVYNGELYNYKELRVGLQNSYDFKTGSDTEVVLASYLKHGIHCLEQFNGMFALAIYDFRSKKLLLARDRLGIKPLYYVHNNDLVCFSSEIKAILKSGCSNKKINRKALKEYLNYQTVYCPNTMVEDIKMLKPGHFIEIDSNLGFQYQTYWSFPSHREDEGNPDLKTAQNDIQERLTKSIERRLIADVPVSAFLSGGIDSSAIVSLAAKNLGVKLDTYTVTFDDQEFSEARFAQKIADQYDTNHHEIKLDPNDLLNDLPNALDHMDHPSTDGPNTFVISKNIKKDGIKVALSGLGGDELFAGYDLFTRTIAMQSKLENLKWMPTSTLGKILNSFGKDSITIKKLSELLQHGRFDLESCYGINRKAFLDKDVSEILNISDFQEDFGGFNSSPFGKISSISQFDIETYMQNVLLRDTDQMSMANALEVRVPFLDHDLVEYVLRLGDKIKYPFTPKKLLVDSLADMLPDYIVNRPKMGFTLPWKNWMKNELFAFCDGKVKSLAQREWVNDTALLRLWDDFVNEKGPYSWSRIWGLITLEHWLEKNGLE
ncbi:MAG: asparagine synthase (glutamine-hydrolyzing) [Flavobacteriales bacterium]|nr:asparagine synthase (glutamine-hydrolyzing) [Flavobacteriales bacterium]